MVTTGARAKVFWSLPERLLAKKSAGHAFQAVDQLGQLHGWRVLDKKVDVVIFAIHLFEVNAKILAYSVKGVVKHSMRAVRQYISPKFSVKDQMGMQRTHNIAAPTAFDRHRLTTFLRPIIIKLAQ